MLQALLLMAAMQGVSWGSTNDLPTQIGTGGGAELPTKADHYRRAIVCHQDGVRLLSGAIEAQAMRRMVVHAPGLPGERPRLLVRKPAGVRVFLVDAEEGAILQLPESADQVILYPAKARGAVRKAVAFDLLFVNDTPDFAGFELRILGAEAEQR